jgi:hypothetical protein
MRELNLMCGAVRINIAQLPAPHFKGQQRINPNLISFEADRYTVFVLALDMNVRCQCPFISSGVREVGRRPVSNRMDTPAGR